MLFNTILLVLKNDIAAISLLAKETYQGIDKMVILRIRLTALKKVEKLSTQLKLTKDLLQQMNIQKKNLEVSHSKVALLNQRLALHKLLVTLHKQLTILHKQRLLLSMQELKTLTNKLLGLEVARLELVTIYVIQILCQSL